MKKPATAGQERLPSVYLPHNSLGDRTLYMNCGYWADSPASYDDACEALVEKIAGPAAIGPEDVILDVGFGYGDQDAYIMRRYGPARLIGLNISAYQVAEAKRRLESEPWSDRVDLRIGDAVATGLPDASVDVVLAVECSAHFTTRDAFLAEARRVLKPGGRLVMGDVLLPSRRLKPISRLVVKSLVSFWQAPEENMYTIERYAERIAAAGYGDIAVASIAEHVFQPLMNHTRSTVVGGRLPDRMDASLKLAYRICTFLQSRARYRIPLEYAVAIARRL